MPKTNSAPVPVEDDNESSYKTYNPVNDPASHKNDLSDAISPEALTQTFNVVLDGKKVEFGLDMGLMTPRLKRKLNATEKVDMDEMIYSYFKTLLVHWSKTDAEGNPIPLDIDDISARDQVLMFDAVTCDKTASPND